MENMIVSLGAYNGYLGKETQTVSAANTAQRQNIMVAYANKDLRFGAEYFMAKNWNTVLSVLEDKADGYSLWGSVAVAKDVNVFARYDNANLSKVLDDNAKDVYYNLGAEYAMTKGVKIAAVWKHQNTDKTVSVPASLHVQSIKTDEVGVWGEVKF